MSHTHLTTILKHLDYPIKGDGCCEGIGWIGMFAALSRDITTFNDRLFVMEELFNQHIQRYGNFFNYNENDSLLYVASRIKEDYNMLSFCDSVIMFFMPDEHQHLFEEDKKPNYQRDPVCINSLLSLSLPISLASKGGIQKVASFSSVYKSNDLFKYLSQFVCLCDNSRISAPVGILLSTFSHTISVTYDPISAEWSFVDANNLPIKTTTSTEELTKYVEASFRNSGTYTLSSEIYTLKKWTEFFNPYVAAWFELPCFRELHEVNYKQLSPDELSSWLLLAIQNDLTATVNDLLNYSFFSGTKLELSLFICEATTRGNFAIIEALLNQGAPINIQNPAEIPLIGEVVFKNYLNVLKLFLDYKPDLNIQDLLLERTPLHYAAVSDSFAAASLLLERGANPNIRDFNGARPLDLAKHKGNKEIANLLSKYMT